MADERVGVRPDPRAPPEPPVLGNARVRQCAPCADGAQDELARLVGSSGSGASSTAREDALGQVVASLEPVTRPEMTISPLCQSASSTTFAGFQFHIPPPPSPSKSRDASGPRSRIARAASTSSGLRAEHVAAPGMVLPHRRAEERPILDREEARLVRPVLEDTPARKQARHCLARYAPTREPMTMWVASLDRGDRVELDAGERESSSTPARPSP